MPVEQLKRKKLIVEKKEVITHNIIIVLLLPLHALLSHAHCMLEKSV